MTTPLFATAQIKGAFRAIPNPERHDILPFSPWRSWEEDDVFVVPKGQAIDLQEWTENGPRAVRIAATEKGHARINGRFVWREAQESVKGAVVQGTIDHATKKAETLFFLGLAGPIVAFALGWFAVLTGTFFWRTIGGILLMFSAFSPVRVNTLAMLRATNPATVLGSMQLGCLWTGTDIENPQGLFPKPIAGTDTLIAP